MNGDSVVSAAASHAARRPDRAQAQGVHERDA